MIRGKNTGGKKRRQCKRNRYGTLMRSDKNRGHGRLAGRFAQEGVTARGTTLGAYRQYCLTVGTADAQRRAAVHAVCFVRVYVFSAVRTAFLFHRDTGPPACQLRAAASRFPL